MITLLKDVENTGSAHFFLNFAEKSNSNTGIYNFDMKSSTCQNSDISQKSDNSQKKRHLFWLHKNVTIMSWHRISGFLSQKLLKNQNHNRALLLGFEYRHF